MSRRMGWSKTVGSRETTFWSCLGSDALRRRGCVSERITGRETGVAKGELECVENKHEVNTHLLQ